MNPFKKIIAKNEKIIAKNNIEIFTECFGKSSDPALLLMMGAGASMIWWDELFCEKLASEGLFVIRYDNRDTGKSSIWPPGKPAYSVTDMAADVINILDGYSIAKAHLAGMSLGGMLAQIVAVSHPERVDGIILLSSGLWDDLPELGEVDTKIIEYHSSAASLDWTNENETIKYMADGWKLLNGSRHTFDKDQAINLARTEYRRAKSLQSMFNHSLIKGGENLYGKSKDINTPCLIIHGTEDTVLPFAHALAINKTIHNSELFPLEGAGHEIHRMDWEIIIEKISQKIKSS